MYQKISIAFLALSAAACATTGADNREMRANSVMEEIVEKDPDMTAEEANTAREFVMREEDGDRVICKRRQVTGSRFHKKVCMTWREWQDLEERGDFFTERMRQKSSQVDVPRGQ